MTPIDVLIAVAFVASLVISYVAYTRRIEIDSLLRALWASERARFVLEADVRALRRQRDFAEEEMARVSRNDSARIAALEERLAKFDRVRDARGRIVGRP